MTIPKHERGEAQIADLSPADYNPRRISDEALAGLGASLKRFGVVQDVVVNRRTNRIVGGHQRVAALKVAGEVTVPVVWVDLDETQERALNVALNSPAISGEWDEGKLADLLDELHNDLPALDWEELRLGELVVDAPIAPAPGDDDAPALDEQGEPDSKPGAIYDLGPHRLVCGDSTTTEAWDALLGDEKIQLVWTDPPYCVAYRGGKVKKPRSKIENDDLDEGELRSMLDAAFGGAHARCNAGAAWYVSSPPGPLFGVFGAALGNLAVWRHTLAWVKDVLVIGRADYHYRHEPIFYGWTEGVHYFVDDRTQSSVFEIPKPRSSDYHPTMKPVELVRRCVANSSKPGWIVADPFGGSGTTLIAAALEGRRARLIEIDRRYCDVIRKRWTTWAFEHGQDPGSGALR